MAGRKDEKKDWKPIPYRPEPDRWSSIELGENVAPMLDLSLPGPFDEVLDVGCGHGFVACVFAPYVRKAVGIDILPDLVQRAAQNAREKGRKNVEFRQANAEEMPFPDGSFDIVASRFAFHHFERPWKVLSEIRRVCRPMSRVVVYDMMSSADEAKSILHNEIERVRDPSHVRTYQNAEFRALFQRAGLEVRAKVTVLMKRLLDDWLDGVAPPPERRALVRKMMAERAAVRDAAGLGVRLRGDKITFTHTCAVWLLVLG